MFFSNVWLYSYAGNTEISERWQVLKEDISMNKLTFFIVNWKAVATSIFPLCYLATWPGRLGCPPKHTHRYTLTHAHFLSEHKFLFFEEILRCLTNFFTNKKIYIFININYDNPISSFSSLKIIFLCYLSWF